MDSQFIHGLLNPLLRNLISTMRSGKKKSGSCASLHLRKSGKQRALKASRLFCRRAAPIGVYNSRGFHACGDGGDQERALAEKHRNWARQLVFEYPYVANLVEGIAQKYDREAA